MFLNHKKNETKKNKPNLRKMVIHEIAFEASVYVSNGHKS